MMTPREAAYHAIIASLRNESFVPDALEKQRQRLTPADFRLAQEIAYGTTRMALALDHLAQQGATSGKLPTKPKQKALLRLAVYQLHFMNRIPDHAAVNETLKVASKHCHKTFVNFLNALLRNLVNNPPTLPSGDTPEALSVRYSYPLYYVEALVAQHGLDNAKAVLAAGNRPSPPMVRIRPGAKPNPYLTPLPNAPDNVAVIADTTLLPQIATSPDYYIQNATPITLITQLCQQLPHPPQRILDLCASPGGKAIAIHDAFPDAALHANDISEGKVRRLEENLSKYNIEATVTCSPGQTLQSNTPYDLIIVDAPCSNTGTLNKRPEARWRLNDESLQQLETLQLALLDNARTLLSPKGQVWYLTCSILEKENEHIITKACHQLALHALTPAITILPNDDGWDGGFACALTHKK